MKNELDKIQPGLETLEISLEKLKKEFSDSVSRDFAFQVEGIIDELHRNKARKVAFVKKRLTRKIASLKSQVDPVRKRYCGECLAPEDKNYKSYCAVAPAKAAEDSVEN